jgi:rare lipoprotein A (peptidoglycan hydrolase)
MGVAVATVSVFALLVACDTKYTGPRFEGPQPTQRPATAAVTPASALMPVAALGASVSVSGTATWYGTGPGAGDAAAGAELRTGKWRGRAVTVCSGGKCVSVRLTDWCACKGNRIIDLSDEDFRRLAPLSVGIINVTVTHGGIVSQPRPNPTGPPTDIE